MQTMNYYGGGPPASLDYIQTPQHGHHHAAAAAYHPAYAQSIGLRGSGSGVGPMGGGGVNGGGVGAGGGTPPMYRGVVANGSQSAYRDRYASASPNPYAPPSDHPAYGSRMSMATAAAGAGGGYGGDYGHEHSSREVGGARGGGPGFYGYRSDGYRMANGYNQYHHHVQHYNHAQPHLHQHPQHHHAHLHHHNLHPYANPEVAYPHHPPHAYHLGHATHSHPQYMSRSVGGYGYARHPIIGAEHHVYQHPPYQHHQSQHAAAVLHPQTAFPMPGAPSRVRNGAGAADAHSSKSIQSPTTTAIDPAGTPTETASESNGAATVVADAPSPTTPTPPSPPPPSSAPSSTKTSPSTPNDIQAMPTTAASPTNTTTVAAHGSIFGGDSDEHTFGGGGTTSTTELGDGSRASCSYPTPPPSAAPVDATAHISSGPSQKDLKLRKIHHRDKNLSKMAAMNRRLEDANYGPMNEIERTPASGNSPFYDHRTDHYSKSSSYQNARYTARMSSRGTALPLSSPWHAMHSDFYRKRAQTPEMGYTTMLPIMSPISSASNRSSSGNRAGRPSPHSLSTCGVFESDFIPSKKRRKHDAHNHADGTGLNITPLPGFQQAFGSTEIGRFSEVFFNVPESPVETFGSLDSESDPLSPQPWETGDSLEEPHLHVPFGGGSVHSMYADSYESVGSPSSGRYFSELRCSDF